MGKYHLTAVCLITQFAYLFIRIPYTKNFKYFILKDFILVIRQTDGPAIKGGCVTWRSIRAGSRYFSREIVTSKTLTERSERHGVQDFNCVQRRVSGCMNHYESVLSAGALPDCRRQAGKAKTVTNNLPILSVL